METKVKAGVVRYYEGLNRVPEMDDLLDMRLDVMKGKKCIDISSDFNQIEEIAGIDFLLRKYFSEKQ